MTTESAVYDTAGNLKKIVDTLKGITTAEYSTGSKLTKLTQAGGGEVKYTYYENGLLQSQTDACGNTTVYTYDASGRIETVTDGEENTVVPSQKAVDKIWNNIYNWSMSTIFSFMLSAYGTAENCYTPDLKKKIEKSTMRLDTNIVSTAVTVLQAVWG